MKKLIIAAGTGFLGQVLINHFRDKADEIVVLTRGKSAINNNIRYINWDAKTLNGWERELEGTDVLINLAGKSVDCRYTVANKHEILASRIDSTAILSKAVSQCVDPPKHWLNSSTATIYRHSEDKQMDEATGEIGSDFSMNVAKAWERVFFETETLMTIKTALRTSIVLGHGGGAYIPLKRLSQWGMGGKQGSGRQFVSWIHEADFARAVEFVIYKQLTGKINIVSPQPVRNEEFMRQLRKCVGMTFGINTPKVLLTFGANLIGIEPELVLKSRNVIPKKLIDHGFEFKYGNLENALRALK